MPKKAVQMMKPYQPPTAGRLGKRRLDFNENTLGCSSRVLARLKKITVEDCAVYPEYTLLKKQLARSVAVAENEVLPTNGTDEAIKCIIDTFLEKGDEIIIPIPTYSMFRIYAEIAEAKITYVLYNNDLSFPIEKLLKAITDTTRLVVLVNPNNPTGTPILQESIRAIIEKTKKGMVLVDEAYYQYNGVSCKDLIKQYKNLIVLQTFSKVFGLAGLRMGYILSDAENIRVLAKVLSPYSVNIFASILAGEALKDKQFVDDYIAETSKSKVMLAKALQEWGFMVYPSSTNFVVVNFGKSYQRIYTLLKDRRILVRDVSSYPLLENCLRITLGTVKQTTYFLKELKQIIQPKALLFDMDGVLVDVSNSYRTAIKKTVAYFSGEVISNEKIQEFKNRGGFNNDGDLTEAILLSSGKKINKKEIKKLEIIKQFQRYYLGNDLGNNKKLQKIFDGLINNERWLVDKKVLTTLRKKYRLGIVTGRPRREAAYALKRAGVSSYFKCVVTLDETKGREKPDAYPLQCALEQLKVINAIYVGDAIDDYQAATNAGITFIGCIPPQLSTASMLTLKKRFRGRGVTKIIDDINKISEVLP